MDPLEALARQQLAARKFRKARDGLKLLCKKDRAKYLPLLIQANAGLVEEMLAKGHVSDAQQVVAYLKTIAPEDVIKRLEAQLAAKSGDATQLAPIALGLLTESTAALSPSERIRWADLLVTTFAPVPAETPAERQIAGEVQAIHEGLKAIAAGQNECARDWVRPLARGSMFFHWTMWVKALAAFHIGEKEKAARYFSELPPDSVPGRAREPYLLALGTAEVGSRAWPEPVIDVIARLLGCANLGRLVARAQTAWQAGRYIESYRVLRDTLPDFPREGLDAPGVLSEFFFNAIFSLPEQGQFACEEFFINIEADNRAKNAVERMWIRRTICLLRALNFTADDLKLKWEGFLQDHHRLHGDNPRLASAGYAWLGEKLGQAMSARRFRGHGDSRLRHAPGAIDSLKKSIALNPANLGAHLTLAEVYKTQKLTSERNRLLDVMTARFPDRKEVLVLAGAGCLERKAYVKGLEYLQKARQLDRIDPAIPDFIARGLLQLATQDFEKGRRDSARKSLAQIDEFLIAQPENFLRNPWCCLARRGLLEQLHGDAAQAKDFLAGARAASPFPAAFAFLAQVVWRACADGATAGAPFEKDLEAAASDKPSVAHALVLMRIWLFEQEVLEGTTSQSEQNWLRHYLNTVAKQPFTRDEATALVELIEPHEEFHRQAEALVKQVLKKDKLDPLFRLFQRDLRPFQLTDPDQEQDSLQAILQEARRRGDEKAVQLARQLLASLNSLPAAEFDDDLDEFENDFAEGPMDFSMPPMPPELAGSMANLAKLFSGLSKKDLNLARKNPPKGIPIEFIEALIAMAESGLPFPPVEPLPSPPVPRPVRPPPGPPRDPNQLDLF